MLNDKYRKAGQHGRWVYKLSWLAPDSPSNIVFGVCAGATPKYSDSCLGLGTPATPEIIDNKEWG